MVRQKQTQSYKDKYGNLSAGRGAVKRGAHHG